MIEPRHVRERASKLFYDIKRRSEPRLWKSGPRVGKIIRPAIPVPYSSEAFATWLLETVGCRAFLCPYCNAPLDVFTMTLDHGIPISIGGTNEFDNLVPCCADCNKLKHSLTGEQYLELRRKLRELHPAIEANVLARLRAAALGQTLLWQKNAKKPQPSLVTSDETF